MKLKTQKEGIESRIDLTKERISKLEDKLFYNMELRDKKEKKNEEK
jgi:hypothetical protein